MHFLSTFYVHLSQNWQRLCEYSAILFAFARWSAKRCRRDLSVVWEPLKNLIKMHKQESISRTTGSKHPIYERAFTSMRPAACWLGDLDHRGRGRGTGPCGIAPMRPAGTRHCSTWPEGNACEVCSGLSHTDAAVMGSVWSPCAQPWHYVLGWIRILHKYYWKWTLAL